MIDASNQNYIKKFKKQIILLHTLVALVSSLLIYLWKPELAKTIFLASLVFNIYLRMLLNGFSLWSQELNPLSILFSSLRVILAGLALGYVLIKFKLSLTGLGIAFLLYKVVLLGFGFYAHYNRDFRKDRSR